MPDVNYEELSLDDLLEIINATQDYSEEVAAAFEELRVRSYIMAKGGDRPTVPPRNP